MSDALVVDKASEETGTDVTNEPVQWHCVLAVLTPMENLLFCPQVHIHGAS
jgi:hypothetical protein